MKSCSYLDLWEFFHGGKNPFLMHSLMPTYSTLKHKVAESMKEVVHMGFVLMVQVCKNA